MLSDAQQEKVDRHHGHDGGEHLDQEHRVQPRPSSPKPEPGEGIGSECRHDDGEDSGYPGDFDAVEEPQPKWVAGVGEQGRVVSPGGVLRDQPLADQRVGRVEGGGEDPHHGEQHAGDKQPEDQVPGDPTCPA